MDRISQAMRRVRENRSSTRVANSTHKFSEESFAFKEVTWEIPNFMDLPTLVDYCVASPEFRFANATWRLQIYTYGQSGLRRNVNYIILHVVRLHSSVPVHYLRYKLGFKTRDGKDEGLREDTFLYHNTTGGITEHVHRQKVISQSHELLPNKILTVFCQMRVKEEATLEALSHSLKHRNEPSQTDLQEASSQTDVPQSVTQRNVEEASSQTDVPQSVTQKDVEDASTSVQKLQLDYSKLLKSEEDSDVCLKVSNKEFRTHKCILRARSAVFHSMFKYETEEKASGEVVIDDLDPDSFPEFLQHVYAGRVESLSDENVFNLYMAADKYDLQELKWECDEYMKCNLSVDTFCDVMMLALRHKEEELLKEAIEYFSANLTKIIVTVKWQTFSKDHNTEANELLIKALVP